MQGKFDPGIAKEKKKQNILKVLSIDWKTLRNSEHSNEEYYFFL